MKTLVNSKNESVFLIPEFIPIKENKDGTWTVGEKILDSTELQDSYTVYEVSMDNLPRQWSPKKYFFDGKDWNFNANWDGVDYNDNKNLERKVHRLIKILHDKDILDTAELHKLSGIINAI